MSDQAQWATDELYAILTNVNEKLYQQFMHLMYLGLAHNFPVPELAATLKDLCRKARSKNVDVGLLADYEMIIRRGFQDVQEQAE